ncbi:MAG: metallopeptidase family protein [Dehalococcoidia bacterium]|nr:metallopeptidase family protein [Dehalococcoidia bacterium]
MDIEVFNQFVDEALEGVPENLSSHIENLSIVVDSFPDEDQLFSVGLQPGDTLFGLYQGVPLPLRSANYSLVLPDVITIYKDVIEAECRSDLEIREQVRKTVIHELGHYFGFNDDELYALEKRWNDAGR